MPLVSSTVFTLADAATGRRLVRLLKRFRSQGLSYQAIAVRLNREYPEIDVADETVRRWCLKHVSPRKGAAA